VAAALTALLIGCGPAQPRFTSTEKTATPHAAQREVPRDTLSKEVAQEIKENDKTVDAAEIESIASGTHDFNRDKNSAFSNLDQSRVMREVGKYMGVPYLLGGASGEGLDCSAYTMLVYKQALKKDLPRLSLDQSKAGSPVEPDNLKFGDLVFFNTTGEAASHVGIYLGDDLFAHASVSLGVTISSLQSSYYKNRYESARRIVE
jgi:cell wall-associated NlpC family hydrolase